MLTMALPFPSELPRTRGRVEVGLAAQTHEVSACQDLLAPPMPPGRPLLLSDPLGLEGREA